MSWKTVCASQEEGRLGIKDVGKINMTLLAKWKWRLVLEENGLWKKVIEFRYGSGERWMFINLICVLYVERVIYLTDLIRISSGG